MNIRKARLIALKVSTGILGVEDWKRDRTPFHDAFHRLDRSGMSHSDPDVRQRDRARAQLIWNLAGRIDA